MGSAKHFNRVRVAPSGRSIDAVEFKSRCLELINQVHQSGVEYVVIKRGRPVARLVRDTSPGNALFGSMRGSVLKYARPFKPIDGEWDVNCE
jgi:antitoxin (DNA-binding transcriptional repressor) of toxin-antitoxin stability system